MLKRVSTQLDVVLLRRLRLEAIRQGRHIGSIIAEALTGYLDERGTPAATGGAVAGSWGVLTATPEEVRQTLREEEDFLGA